jgi:putative oxidoreductase
MNVVGRPRSLAIAILRVGAGLLFMEHGVQKLFGFMGGFGSPGQTAPMASRFGVAGVLECGGGLLIVIGLFTRPIAIVLALEMVVAFSIGHLPRGGWPVENGGELALLYALIYVLLAAHGAGAFSVDERLARPRD